MITQVKKSIVYGARTSRINQGQLRPTSATGGQAFVSRYISGPKSITTEYNNKYTTKNNAVECRKSYMNETRMLKKENIDICCIHKTHFPKDNRFRIRGYQCFRTDREGDIRNGGF